MSPSPFMTDDEAARRLAQVENQLADFEAKVPGLRREIATIREGIEPSGAEGSHPQPEAQS